VKNAKALAEAMIRNGYRLTSGGTDNHLMLVDLRARDANLTGFEAAGAMEKAGIIANANGVPFDPRPPRVTSGIRLGTPALTTRGLKESDMATVAGFIDRAIAARADESALAKIRGEVAEMCRKFPMPH
jgi:glycine hydroxymethyltransferase